MTVRILNPSDVDIFRSLRLEALELDPDNFASDRDEWEVMSEDQWRSFLENEPIFAAFDDEQAVGITGLIFQKRRRMAHRCGIGMVYVRRSHRGCGIADSLLKAAINHARNLGIRQVELSVNAENSGAIRLYERHGFTHYGRLPRGFRQGKGFVDDALMVLALDTTDEQINKL
ncbi:MAG: GNAT family N-acetyltransferase [Boseongicola sp.]|nr:MAG: GNAT family N-acetyltransferase [Boseongicola sp.]